MCVLLKVEEASYVFEAKTIQRMELLILSTLQWRMHPVTPISYLDHIIRRFSFKSHQQLEFLSRCESLLLSIVPGNNAYTSLYMSFIRSLGFLLVLNYTVLGFQIRGF